MKPTWRPWTALLVAVIAAGCAGEGGPSSWRSEVSEPQFATAGVDLFADVTGRDTSPQADGQAVQKVVTGINDFSVRLFRAAVGSPTVNAVVGNYSLGTTLLLTMAGTGGVTTDAFADMLGVEELAPSDLHPAVNAIDLILESRAADGLALSTADKIFVQEGLRLRDEFLDVAVGSYGAPVAAVDFVRAGDEVVKTVNDWVAEQTNGFIDKLTDGYTPRTRVVLANAMYLRASWAVRLRRLDQPGRFTSLEGEAVEVEIMGHDEYLPLHLTDDITAVELPYVGGNLGLVMVMPIDLVEFEAELDGAKLTEITDGLAEDGIHLTMPIWSTKTDIEALEPLHEIGLPTEYDFSGMLEGGETGYFIESVSHVARIDVDETGTTAGAASDLAIAGSHGPTVAIDRPFFYFIRDRGSGLILFMGHVTDPSPG